MVKRLVFGTLTILVSLLLTFVLLEAVTRLVIDDGMQFDLEMWKYARFVKEVSDDPLIGHVHGANRRARLMGVDFQTNSKGLRDREIEYARVPGRLRVMMLGDSLTVGWGVASEDTFVKQVENHYKAAGIDAEVINAGVGNYNTVQEVRAFMTEGYKYKPDVIVLNFFVNDAELATPVKAPSPLMRACYSCVFAAGRIDAISRTLFGKTDWAGYYLGLYGDGTSQGWLDAKEAIRELAEYCKQHRIDLLVASLPELHDIERYRLQRITELVRDTAAKLDVPFVDALPYLKGEESSRLWVTRPDPHPNALADRLIARALFEALEKRRTTAGAR